MSDVSKCLIDPITSEGLQQRLKLLENDELMLRFTLATGWALHQVDQFTALASPLLDTYHRLICTINIEVEQIPGKPRHVFLWANLPPLQSSKTKAPEAPFQVIVHKSASGKMFPTFTCDIDPRADMNTQLESFSTELNMYYMVNCEQPAVNEG
jgi:hypothetical protein